MHCRIVENRSVHHMTSAVGHGWRYISISDKIEWNKWNIKLSRIQLSPSLAIPCARTFYSFAINAMQWSKNVQHLLPSLIVCWVRIFLQRTPVYTWYIGWRACTYCLCVGVTPWIRCTEGSRTKCVFTTFRLFISFKVYIYRSSSIHPAYSFETANQLKMVQSP